MLLLLTLDGFRPDYLDWEPMPHLSRLLRLGTRVVDARACFPTLTTVNMACLLTGCYPQSTGIGCVPLYDRQADAVIPTPRANHRTTLAEWLAQQGWRTAAVNHFLLENRGAQIYLSGGPREVERLIATERPDFLAYLHGEVDAVGHAHGPFSEPMRRALQRVDQAVARILRALEDRGLLGRSLIAVTSDHGMSDFGRNVGGDVASILRGLGLEVFQYDGRATQPSPRADVVVIGAGNRHIYWRRPVPERIRKAAEERLAAVAGAVLLKPADLQALHCDLQTVGDLVVTPLPGFVMSGGGSPGGLHGRLEELRILMGFFGGRAAGGSASAGPAEGGQAGGRMLGTASIVDVFPTLLSLAGVAPCPGVEGRALL
ncbi:MAG: alkaline phosphatase family protein [Firmicutes bacterium]|nr:alkaline phosphatase family protein [Bacillota bacterium]